MSLRGAKVVGLVALVVAWIVSWPILARAEIDPEAPTASVSWCQGPWTLGCEGDRHKTASIPIGTTIRDAVVLEPSAVGWKWFSYIDGPPGCIFVGNNGRDYPNPDRKAGFFVQGYAPIKGLAGRSCAGWGITTKCGALSCY